MECIDWEGKRKEAKAVVNETFDVEAVRKDKDGQATEQLLSAQRFELCPGEIAAQFKAIEAIVRAKCKVPPDVPPVDWTGVEVHVVRPFRR